MAGLLATSMEAPAVDVNDVPDHPYYVNTPADDEDKAEALAEPVKKTKPQPVTAAKPIVPKTPITPKIPTTPRSPITPTYKPAFVPPKPAAPAPKPTEKPKADLSKVGPGISVIHKAFGEGSVVAIEKKPTGSTYVQVKFGETVRSFGYPGAFYDGFLRVKD